MRVLGIPFVILGVLAATGSTSSDEPSESAMRAAFETRLGAQVRSVLDFVAETGGEEAQKNPRRTHRRIRHPRFSEIGRAHV